MTDEWDVDVDAEMIAEMLGEILVGTFSGDPDWNAEIRHALL